MFKHPFIARIKGFFTNLKSKFIVFAKSKPLPAFLTLLGVLFVLILVSNFLQKPKVESQVVTEVVKSVSVYSVGQAPTITLQGKIEKTGTVTILAQAAGIVQSVNIKEGQKVVAGTNLLQLASNYAGNNAFALQRQIAQKQYDNAQATHPIQKEIITKNRDLAQKSESTAYDIREITRKTLDDTRNLTSLNDEIVRNIENQIKTAPDDATANTFKQIKAQVQAGNLQLKNALNQSEYQSNNDQEPAQSAILGRDIALKNLELQEKSLDLGLEIARLQLQLAWVQENLYHPTSPFAGVVEKVHVKKNDFIQPGTPLITLTSSNNSQAKAVVTVSKDIAKKVSSALESKVIIAGTSYPMRPLHISTAPVEGSLYAITYILPPLAAATTYDNAFINVEMALQSSQTSAVVPMLPLDALYQTQGKAYIFVVDGERAKTVPVTIGEVQGSLVEIKNGITSGMQVITTRGVVDGEKISVL